VALEERSLHLLDKVAHSLAVWAITTRFEVQAKSGLKLKYVAHGVILPRPTDSFEEFLRRAQPGNIASDDNRY